MKGVFRSFGAGWAALRFWAANAHTLVRLAWFPLAMLGIAGYGLAYWNSTALLVMAEGRARGIEADAFFLPEQNSFGGMLVWAVLQLIALSAAAVAVHRFVIARERLPGECFAFAFGRAELGYFAMGVTSYVLVAMLLTGQFLAQFAIPPLDDYVFNATMKPYSDSGPLVLGLFILPFEEAIFQLPLPVYAAWCALVFATAFVLIRISPWPATVAMEQGFALRQTLALTRGRALSVVAFFSAIGTALAIALAVLVAVGLSSLAAVGSDGLASVMKSIVSSGDGSEALVQYDEIRGIQSERIMALYHEIARFIAGLFGVTLGATLISHLYLTLRVDEGAD